MGPRPVYATSASSRPFVADGQGKRRMKPRIISTSTAGWLAPRRTPSLSHTHAFAFAFAAPIGATQFSLPKNIPMANLEASTTWSS
uniref:Uncharacterized protein n=1 Tax=Oryza rufipogon TaxID=4529 RepID=A0A0E0PDZ2_ORYRU